MIPNNQASIPTIMQMVEQIHLAKDQILQLWNEKKIKLDQCYQLRHFEQDCRKVRQWEFCFACGHSGWTRWSNIWITARKM